MLTLETIRKDFARLGLTPFDLGQFDARLKDDRETLKQLVELRNALSHGDRDKLRELRTQGVRDTVSWVRQRLPALNRVAKALDHLVWDHLATMTESAPWR